MSTQSGPPATSFAEHVALLEQFVSHRTGIVERIEHDLLNVRDKDTSRSRDRTRFQRVLDACFFGAPGLPEGMLRLKGQLRAHHLAEGFVPVQIDRYTNELDPLELVVRAYEHWEHHRWPGKAGRTTFAQSIYVVVMLRYLEHLSLLTWEDGDEQAGGNLAHVQRLLDAVNAHPNPCVLVRDARWLMQTAQGPFTLHLAPYFAVAEHIAASFTTSDRVGIHAAGAKLTGGHLRSQLQYRMWSTRRPVGDVDNLSFTRNSNALDGALLVSDLVPLLRAYRDACRADAGDERMKLADAILQGMSADPELFVGRLDLLTPSTMIEGLFIEGTGDRGAHYTGLGEKHVGLLAQYGELVGELAPRLLEDAAQFDPSGGVYSPYGISYGFCADLLSSMVMDTLLAQPSFGLTLEDVFDSRGSLDHKVARGLGWRALPLRPGEREHFGHSPEFAAQIFARLTLALEARRQYPDRPNASAVPDARLFVVPVPDGRNWSPERIAPAGIASANEYCFTSGATTSGHTAWPTQQILTDRNEGRYLASTESGGTWHGISKIVLTMFTSQGRDVLVTGVPGPAIDILRLTCPGLVAVVAA